jgi:large-conductance mechanosensitive channel
MRIFDSMVLAFVILAFAVAIIVAIIDKRKRGSRG